MKSFDRITAPWTPAEVEALNLYQQEGRLHPFTCGGDRGDPAHRAYAAEHGGDNGQLVATEEGWVCPVCRYKQDWAHAFMTSPAAIGSVFDPERSENRTLKRVLGLSDDEA